MTERSGLDLLGEKLNLLLISQAETKKDAHNIISKMEDHDFQSQAFRTALINRVEKMEHSLEGNGKPGIKSDVQTLKERADRGSSLWKLLAGAIVLIGGGLVLKILANKIGI